MRKMKAGEGGAWSKRGVRGKDATGFAFRGINTVDGGTGGKMP